MNNDKNVKQVSRLTGSLLARKGSAIPSQAPLKMHQTASGFFAEEKEPEAVLENGHDPENAVHKALAQINEAQINEAQINEAQINEAQKEEAQITKGKVSAKKSNFVKSSQECAVNRRIAMTLRMVEEDHLKLRIFSAHTRKSCQVILSEALDLYLVENRDKVAV